MRLDTSLAFAALVLSRVVLILIINTIPDMDPTYLRIAAAIFETHERTAISLPFGYGALLYAATRIFGFVWATKLIFFVFSTATGAVLYLWTRAMFERRAAIFAVVLFALVPNFTFALAGFSHTVAVAMFFLVASLYGYWLILRGDARVGVWLATAFAALFAALVRPELALYFAAFVAAQTILLVVRRAKSDLRGQIAALAVLIAIFGGGLTLNYALNLARSSSAQPTVFTDSEHAYLTYMHTLGLRAGRGIRDDVAAELGAQTFGDAAANQHSILRAVRNNPREAVKNIGFNTKDLFDNIVHHLFMPFFVFFLVGVGLLAADWRALWREQTFLLASLLPCVAALIAFHVEVRYLNPIAVAFTIWAALGLNLVDSRIRKPVAFAIFAALILLFAAECVYFSQNPIGQIKI